MVHAAEDISQAPTGASRQLQGETEIETRIQASNPTNRRLTPADIDNMIADIKFHRFEGTALIVCCLVLKSGFYVVGESAAADPADFREDIGKDSAFKHARDKISGDWSTQHY